MLKILIDTCVWLGLAKDYQRLGVLGVLQALVGEKQASIILPRTVLDEFSRNKARVADEGGRSLSSILKGRETTDRFYVRAHDRALEPIAAN